MAHNCAYELEGCKLLVLIVCHSETKYKHWEHLAKANTLILLCCWQLSESITIFKMKRFKKSASGIANFMCHFKESLNRKFLSVAYIRKSKKFLSGLMPKDIPLVFHQE